MTWSASSRIASVSPRAAKYWKVPTRIWLDATRVSMAPGRTVSRMTGSPVVTAARARVVGMPIAAMASLTRYSRSTGPSAARPSPPRENGVRPAPLSWMSRRRPSPIYNLAQQDCAAIAELRHEVPELMSGIGLRDGLRSGGYLAAGEHIKARRAFEPLPFDAKLVGELLVDLNQGRRGALQRTDGRKETLGQPGVAVLEWDGHLLGNRLPSLKVRRRLVDAMLLSADPQQPDVGL